MGEIPEDVMRVAREVVGTIEAMPSEGNVGIVARAILAERQRCADVARAYLEDLAGCDMRDDEPELLEAAILNQ
jgi:hypothetical protein